MPDKYDNVPRQGRQETFRMELPLFVLDVVLFPGTVLPLHVFEPRYRQMIRDCQRDNKPFGVVLAMPGDDPLNERPYTIGTVAEIHNLECMEDGRYMLMAVGSRRFRIVDQHNSLPYLSGVVESYEEEIELDEELTTLKDLSKRLFSRYLEMLLEATHEGKDMQLTLPEDPEELSYFIAYLLDISDERKQQFLEQTSTKQRLEDEIAILRREVPFMREILSRELPPERTLLN